MIFRNNHSRGVFFKNIIVLTVVVYCYVINVTKNIVKTLSSSKLIIYFERSNTKIARINNYALKIHF